MAHGTSTTQFALQTGFRRCRNGKDCFKTRSYPIDCEDNRVRTIGGNGVTSLMVHEKKKCRAPECTEVKECGLAVMEERIG